MAVFCTRSSGRRWRPLLFALRSRPSAIAAVEPFDCCAARGASERAGSRLAARRIGALLGARAKHPFPPEAVTPANRRTRRRPRCRPSSAAAWCAATSVRPRARLVRGRPFDGRHEPKTDNRTAQPDSFAVLLALFVWRAPPGANRTPQVFRFAAGRRGRGRTLVRRFAGEPVSKARCAFPTNWAAPFDPTNLVCRVVCRGIRGRSKPNLTASASPVEPQIDRRGQAPRLRAVDHGRLMQTGLRLAFLAR
jgi:hypothetical protein